MAMSEARSVAEAAVVQLDEPVSVYPDNIPEGADERDDGHVEQIWDQQGLNDQSASGVSALLTI